MSDRKGPVMGAVFSSHVDRVGYDMGTQQLYVQWDTGKTSVYSGVPPDVAHEAQNSWSIGTYLTRFVKPHFQHRYMSDD